MDNCARYCSEADGRPIDVKSDVCDYWVVNPVTAPSQISEKAQKVTMSNGIIKREFSIEENFVTFEYLNMFTGVSLVDKENIRTDAMITLDDKVFNIGGPGDAESTFTYDSYKVEDDTEKPFDWTYDPKISDPGIKSLPWPAKGKALIVKYKANENFLEKYKGVSIEVRYEIYDGLPVICKKVTVTNNGEAYVVVTKLISEVIPMLKSNKEALYMESSFNSGNENHSRNNGRHNTWTYIDKESYGLLISQYANLTYKDLGPAWRLTNGQVFEGYRLYELFHCVDYYEWRCMEVKKMYRTLFPQIGDNPTTLHLLSNNAGVIKKEIDKASEVGIDMIISTFASNVNIEDISTENIAYYKDIYDYAKQKGIYMGSYVMQVAREDQEPNEQYDGCWGTMRCMASAVADKWYEDVLKFIDETGLKGIEIDGIYPNTVCDNVGHLGHDGMADSVAKQWEKAVKGFFRKLRERDVLINAPDWLFLTGANKAVMGYEEIAFSQPRLEQLIYGRLIAYNGTFQKVPSMGWTLVPFSQYHGGGDAATLMPFDKNIYEYDYIIAINFMSGMSGSFRGPSMYDSEMSKRVMKYWTGFFKKYKEILNGDVVHIAPPNFKEGTNNLLTEDIDGILHTSAQSDIKGMLVLYNTTGEKVIKKVKVPLYYSGLTGLKMPPAPVNGSHVRQMPKYGEWPPVDMYMPDAPEIVCFEGPPTDKKAFVCQGDINGREYVIDSNGNIEIEVSMEPGSYAWYTIYAPDTGPESTTMITAPENVCIDCASHNRIDISWDAVVVCGEKVKDYNIFRNGEYVVKVFTNRFTDIDIVECERYSYEIAAVYNTVCGTKSSDVTVCPAPDAAAPEIEAAKATSDYNVDIVFSKKVLKDLAEKAANYTVKDNSVVNARLNTDELSVTLTLLQKLAPFNEYEVTVNNIKDSSSSGNIIIDNSKVKFKHGYLRRFSFDEESGKVAIDSINGAHGIISGHSPKRSAGVKNSSLYFEGQWTFVNISNVVDKMDTFSIDGWFKPEDTLEEQTIIGQQQQGYITYRWNLFIERGSLKYLISDESGEIVLALDSSKKILPDEWNYFALVRNGDSFKLYMNDDIVDEGSKAGIVQRNNHNSMFLGAYKNQAGGEPTRLFKGYMDEITFYNVPLSIDYLMERFDEWCEHRC